MTTALSTPRLWELFRPLALSWLFMAVEGPVAIGVLSRLPQPAVNIAALVVLFGVAMWIESPVIDLLSTGTALAKGRGSWASVCAYAWTMGAVSVGAHALVALTPAFEAVIQALHVPPDVANAVRPAFVLLIPWSGFIGWRRVRQGLLIGHGETKIVGRGTTVRMITMITGAIFAGFVAHFPGILAAAMGLILSVAAEAVFVHLASRRLAFVVQANEDEPLSWSRMSRFHLPLALTTMVKLASTPIITAGLGRVDHPVQALAAFEVMSSVLFILRAPMFALPELVIATYKMEGDRRLLFRFSACVGSAASILVVLITVTGGAKAFFAGPMGTTIEVARIANGVLLACVLIPLLEAGHAYLSGVLAAKHRTGSRVLAVATGVAMLIGAVSLAAGLRWPAWTIGGLAKTLETAAEAAILAGAWSLIRRRGPSPSPA